MANQINTRIQLKYDSYANWDAVKTTFVPLKGEICIVNPGTNLSDASTVPCLMKIGDGTNTFEKLPWASATAADVYSWAKQTGLTITKDGTGNVVSGIEWDAAANNGKGGIKFTTASVATSEGLEEVQTDLAALQKTVNDNSAAWAKDDNTTYTFTQGADKRTLTLTPSEGSATSITLEYLTETEINNLLVNSGYITESAIDTKLDAYAKDDEVVKSVSLASGTNNGTVKLTVNGTATDNIAVTGLGTAAYTSSQDYLKSDGSGADQDFNINTNTVEITVADGQFTYNGKEVAIVDDIVNLENAIVEGTTTAMYAETAERVSHTLTIGSKTFNGSVDAEITAADLGLSNALRFVGSFSEAPATAESGDVYLNTATRKEYIYANGEWQEFGDEGSYALKTITITGTDGLTGGGDLTANRTIGIADGGITEAKLAANAVTAEKIASGAVTVDKIPDAEISVDKLDLDLRSSINRADTAVRQVISGNGITVEHQDGYVEKVFVNEVLEHVSQIGDMDIAGIQVDASSQERTSIFGATTVNLTTSSGGQINIDGELVGTAYYHGAELATLSDIETYTGDNNVTVTGNTIALNKELYLNRVLSTQGADYGEINFNSDGMLIDHLQGVTIQSSDGDLGFAGYDVGISSGHKVDITSVTEISLASDYITLNGDVYINDKLVHEIATTGSIYDVAEGSNTSTGTDAVEYLIFNCGTATTII